MLRILSRKNTEQVSDEALLALYVAESEPKHLGELYQRYMDMVYGVCIKILKDQGKAEDAVIGIYEELVRKAKDHKVESFRGWLYVLSRNYCLMEWRKQQRTPRTVHASDSLERMDAVEEAFEYELEFPQRTPPLQECLDKLGDLQKRCVQWFYYEDKSYKEIADTLREDLGKVRSYIQNGKRNLRLCLERAT
jgi:RNA polymerase sigma factor (sigma-70 family)